MFEQIDVKRKNGSESLIGVQDTKLLDYWAWAHSDVIANAERGVLAEFIVGLALGCLGEVRTEWDAYDLLTADGIKVEVKASGCIQTWEQKELSSPYFGIRKTVATNDGGATFTGDKKRQADVYVFCFHCHDNQETANPLDLAQWEFYVLPTCILNEKVPEKKTIGLPALKKLGTIQTDWVGLKDAVESAVSNEI